MDFLARREHSFYELQQKLLLKFPEVPFEHVIEVLNRLHEEKLQSDDRFVESFVRYRKSRGFGYRHIQADLVSRRVSENLIAKHLHRDDLDWQTILADLIERRTNHLEYLEFGSKEHRRIVRLLESRGFELGKVEDALKGRMS